MLTKVELAWGQPFAITGSYASKVAPSIIIEHETEFPALQRKNISEISIVTDLPTGGVVKCLVRASVQGAVSNSVTAAPSK